MKVLPLIFFGSIFVSAHSQSAWTNYSPLNSPLPGYDIKAIVIDTGNIKRFGSSGGLIKFDGTTWTVWDIFNTPALLSHSITSIAIRKDNIKRIGTINGEMAY